MSLPGRLGHHGDEEFMEGCGYDPNVTRVGAGRPVETSSRGTVGRHGRRRRRDFSAVSAAGGGVGSSMTASSLLVVLVVSATATGQLAIASAFQTVATAPVGSRTSIAGRLGGMGLGGGGIAVTGRTLGRAHLRPDPKLDFGRSCGLVGICPCGGRRTPRRGGFGRLDVATPSPFDVFSSAERAAGFLLSCATSHPSSSSSAAAPSSTAVGEAATRIVGGDLGLLGGDAGGAIVSGSSGISLHMARLGEAATAHGGEGLLSVLILLALAAAAFVNDVGGIAAPQGDGETKRRNERVVEGLGGDNGEDDGGWYARARASLGLPRMVPPSAAGASGATARTERRGGRGSEKVREERLVVPAPVHALTWPRLTALRLTVEVGMDRDEMKGTGVLGVGVLRLSEKESVGRSSGARQEFEGVNPDIIEEEYARERRYASPLPPTVTVAQAAADALAGVTDEVAVTIQPRPKRDIVVPPQVTWAGGVQMSSSSVEDRGEKAVVVPRGDVGSSSAAARQSQWLPSVPEPEAVVASPKKHDEMPVREGLRVGEVISAANLPPSVDATSSGASVSPAVRDGEDAGDGRAAGSVGTPRPGAVDGGSATIISEEEYELNRRKYKRQHMEDLELMRRHLAEREERERRENLKRDLLPIGSGQQQRGGRGAERTKRFARRRQQGQAEAVSAAAIGRDEERHTRTLFRRLWLSKDGDGRDRGTRKQPHRHLGGGLHRTHHVTNGTSPEATVEWRDEDIIAVVGGRIASAASSSVGGRGEDGGAAPRFHPWKAARRLASVVVPSWRATDPMMVAEGQQTDSNGRWRAGGRGTLRRPPPVSDGIFSAKEGGAESRLVQSMSTPSHRGGGRTVPKKKKRSASTGISSVSPIRLGSSQTTSTASSSSRSDIDSSPMNGDDDRRAISTYRSGREDHHHRGKRRGFNNVEERPRDNEKSSSASVSFFLRKPFVIAASAGLVLLNRMLLHGRFLWLFAW